MAIPVVTRQDNNAYFNALLVIMRTGLFTPIPAILTHVRNQDETIECVYFFEDSETYYVLPTLDSRYPTLYSKAYYSIIAK